MLLRLENVSLFSEENNTCKKTILSNITFSLAYGDFLGIVGGVGSGKTTVLEIMSGFFSPSKGSLTSKPDLKKCLLFQNSEDIFSQETVYDELALGPRHLGWSESVIRKKAEEVLDKVYITNSFWSRSPFSLSDGEKRRLALALLLLMEPELIFLDEPLQGLDPRNKKTVLNLIKSLKTTVVMVSSLKDMVFYADKLLFLENGRQSFYGSTEEFLKKPIFLKNFEKELPVSVTVYNKLFDMGILKEPIPTLNENVIASLIVNALKNSSVRLGFCVT